MNYNTNVTFVKQRSQSAGYLQQSVYVSPVNSVSDSENECNAQSNCGMANQVLIDTISNAKKQIMEAKHCHPLLVQEPAVDWSLYANQQNVQQASNLKKLIFDAENVIGKTLKFSSLSFDFRDYLENSQNYSGVDLTRSNSALDPNFFGRKRHNSLDDIALDAGSALDIGSFDSNDDKAHMKQRLKRKAAQLQPEETPDTKSSSDSNRAKCLERNRLAAIKSRARKKQLVEEMKSSLSQMQNVNKVLTHLAAELTSELSAAKRRISELEARY